MFKRSAPVFQAPSVSRKLTRNTKGKPSELNSGESKGIPSSRPLPPVNSRNKFVEAVENRGLLVSLQLTVRSASDGDYSCSRSDAGKHIRGF
jgi:hypothetical protein